MGTANGGPNAGAGPQSREHLDDAVLQPPSVPGCAALDVAGAVGRGTCGRRGGVSGSGRANRRQRPPISEGASQSGQASGWFSQWVTDDKAAESAGEAAPALVSALCSLLSALCSLLSRPVSLL